MGRIFISKEYFKSLYGKEPLPHEEQILLFKELRNCPEERATEIRNIIYETNQKFVLSIALKMCPVNHPVLSIMDVVQAGNVGLRRAIDRFDPDKGFRFTTYSYFWIREQIFEQSQECISHLRLPASAFEVRCKLAAKYGTKSPGDQYPDVDTIEKDIPSLKRTNVERYLSFDFVNIDNVINQKTHYIDEVNESIGDKQLLSGILQLLSEVDRNVFVNCSLNGISKTEKDMGLSKYVVTSTKRRVETMLRHPAFFLGNL